MLNCYCTTIGIGIGGGILLLLLTISCAVNVAQYYHKIKQTHLKKGGTYIFIVLLSKFAIARVKEQIELETSKKSSSGGDNQLYAEITDLDAVTPVSTMQNTPTSHGLPVTSSHQYDSVVLNETKSGGDYQFTLCEAYGVH